MKLLLVTGDEKCSCGGTGKIPINKIWNNDKYCVAYALCGCVEVEDITLPQGSDPGPLQQAYERIQKLLDCVKTPQQPTPEQAFKQARREMNLASCQGITPPPTCTLCGGHGPFRTREEIIEETHGRYDHTGMCKPCEQRYYVPWSERKCVLCGGDGPFKTDEEVQKETGGKYLWTNTCTRCEETVWPLVGVRQIAKVEDK